MPEAIINGHTVMFEIDTSCPYTDSASAATVSSPEGGRGARASGSILNTSIGQALKNHFTIYGDIFKEPVEL